MSRKFLETESPQWVDQGIISAEQAQRLLALYPVDAKAIGLLPLLGSLLVALSALSLVAANWRSLPELVRLGILLGAMAGAYGSGEYFRRRGNDQLGIGLVGLGLILFGVSIILVSQMYQLIGYDVTGLVAWAVAATALTYLYRSRFLFLLTVVIGAIVQGYNTEALGAFSYGHGRFHGPQPGLLLVEKPRPAARRRAGGRFALAGGPAGGLPARQNHLVLRGRYGHLRLRRLAGRPAGGAGPAGPAAGGGVPVYARAGRFRGGRQLHRPPEAAAAGLPGGAGRGIRRVATWQAHPRPAQRRHRLAAAAAGLLPAGRAAAGRGGRVVVLYLYTGALLWRANQEQNADRITLGTALFILTTMVAYFKLTWGFMDKSLFFLLGGGLLLGLSWYLRRRVRSEK